MAIYSGSFGSLDEVIHAFSLESSDLDGVEILYAEYERDDGGYEGYAFVLFKKDGLLYEVNASHCSCNGLEEQWQPSLTTVDALLMRPYFKEGEVNSLLLGLKN